MDNKTYTREEVRQMKWDLLHELFLRVEEEETRARKSAYAEGQPVDLESEGRASGLGYVLSMIVGFQNNLW